MRGASTRRGGLRTRVDRSWVEHNDPDKVGKDQVSDLFKSSDRKQRGETRLGRQA